MTVVDEGKTVRVRRESERSGVVVFRNAQLSAVCTCSPVAVVVVVVEMCAILCFPGQICVSTGGFVVFTLFW